MSVSYRGTVYGDKWPYMFNTEATSYHTAASRIMKAYEVRFKGQKRPATITIKIVKGN